jgi:hypothetical protein
MNRTYEALSVKPATRPPAAAKPGVPATLADAAANILAAAVGPAPFLKFKKGKYYVNETEVPLGREFLAYCQDWQYGWVKFVDAQIVDRRIGRAADRFQAPERDQLDCTDASQWPTGIDGKPADPWVFHHYLPVEDLETGERLVFVSSSAGGEIAVQTLCNRYARNIHKGLPTIGLRVGSFNSKKYGATPRPDFPIVAWENDAGTVDVTPPASLKSDMDDEIPF